MPANEAGEEHRHPLVTPHAEALTARPDVPDAILDDVIAEGLAQYHALRELDPCETLRVPHSPPHRTVRRCRRERSSAPTASCAARGG